MAHRHLRQAGGWVDLQRRAGRDHQVAGGGEAVGALDHARKQHLLERHRRRLHQSAAPRAARVGVAGVDLGDRPGPVLAEAAPVRRAGAPDGVGVTDAHHLDRGAVQLDDLARPGRLVQAVDVLRHHTAAAPRLLERGEGVVRRVRLERRPEELPPHLPRASAHVRRLDVPLEGEVHRVVARPDAARRPEVGDAGLGGHARAGEAHDALRCSEEIDEPWHATNPTEAGSPPLRPTVSGRAALPGRCPARRLSPGRRCARPPLRQVAAAQPPATRSRRRRPGTR